jgi:uncharacterized protein (UPF0335 family)
MTTDFKKKVKNVLEDTFGKENVISDAAIGHNRKKPRTGGVAVDQLRSIIERVERLEEEKAGLSSDIRDIYAESKANGFDVKAIRTIIKLRKMDAQEREEAETVLDTYCRALGMTPDLFDGEDAA